MHIFTVEYASPATIPKIGALLRIYPVFLRIEGIVAHSLLRGCEQLLCRRLCQGLSVDPISFCGASQALCGAICVIGGLHAEICAKKYLGRAYMREILQKMCVLGYRAGKFCRKFACWINVGPTASFPPGALLVYCALRGAYRDPRKARKERREIPQQLCGIPTALSTAGRNDGEGIQIMSET